MKKLFMAFALILCTISTAFNSVCLAAGENWNVKNINADSNMITIEFESGTDGVLRWDLFQNYVEIKKNNQPLVYNATTPEDSDFTATWISLGGNPTLYYHILQLNIKGGLSFDTPYTVTLKAGFGLSDASSTIRRTTDYTKTFRLIKLFEDDFSTTPIGQSGVDPNCKWVKASTTNAVYDGTAQTALLANYYPNVSEISSWTDYTIEYTAVAKGTTAANADSKGNIKTGNKILLRNSNNVGFDLLSNGLNAFAGVIGGVGTTPVTNRAYELSYESNPLSVIRNRCVTNNVNTTNPIGSVVYSSSLVNPSATNAIYTGKIELMGSRCRSFLSDKLNYIFEDTTLLAGAPTFSMSRDYMDYVLITKFQAEDNTFVISKVFDSTGQLVTDTISGTLSGTVEIKNSFGTEKPFRLVVASFKNSGMVAIMKDCQVINTVTLAGGATDSFEFELASEDVDSMRIFLWDGFNTMTPYVKSEVLSFSAN